MGDKLFIELARAVRQGYRSALGELLESFRSYLRLFSDRRLGPDLKQKDGASDLVQQTFLDAQQAFPRFVGNTPDELRDWLERILLSNHDHAMLRSTTKNHGATSSSRKSLMPAHRWVCILSPLAS